MPAMGYNASMATEYRTNQNKVKVYDAKGTHVKTIQDKGTLLTVTGTPLEVGKGVSARGVCYPISNPFTGFVPIGMVSVKQVADPPPPPPPDPSPSTGRLWVVKGDEELARYNYKSRTQMDGWAYGAITPSVFRFDKKPTQEPTEYFVDITPMDAALRALNDYNEARINRLYSPGTAVMNRNGFPRLQYLVMSFCTLEEIAIESNCLKFKTLKPTSNTAGMSYATHPQYVMRWDLVTYRNDETLHVIDRKGEIYWFLTTAEGYGYIPLEWVRRK